MAEAKLRLGVLASGRGSNLLAVLNACASSKINAAVEVVISDKPDSQAIGHARRHRVAAVYLNPKDYASREAYDAAAAGILMEHRVDLVVLAGYMRLISSQLIEPYQGRIINIHPSLLPSFPGLRAQKQALDWGVRISGCTVHFVDETTDQGPIIIQAAVPVLEGDTPEVLEARILEQEHRILPQAIQFFAERRLRVSGRRVALKSPKPSTGLGVISPPVEAGL